MYSTDIPFRVRYAEIDKMGWVYYANYAIYYEVGRVEAFRRLGFSYRALEEAGILMPVLHMKVDYFLPAHYDEALSLRVIIPSMPKVRIFFHYELYGETGLLLNKAETVLAFLHHDNRKPVRVPAALRQCLVPFFEGDAKENA